MGERDSSAREFKAKGTGMFQIGRAPEEGQPEQSIKTPGEVVLEALKRAGAIKDWESLEPDHLRFISETNQAVDFLKDIEVNDGNEVK